jgi:hypothetical protein
MWRFFWFFRGAGDLVECLSCTLLSEGIAMAVHDWTLVPAGIFHHFHHERTSAISRALNGGRLPASYYALVDQVAGGLGPDVLTLEFELPPPVARGSKPLADEGDGKTALLLAPPKVRHAQEEELPFAKRKRVVIRHVSGHRVVVVIEIVSPGNKASEPQFKNFIAREWLNGGVHLLIVDLFAPTPRDPRGVHTAIWSEYGSQSFDLTDEEPLTAVSYDASSPKHAYAEVFAAGEPLPDMPIYLQRDRYINVPLEATYQSAWEAVPRFWRQKLQSASSRNGS